MVIRHCISSEMFDCLIGVLPAPAGTPVRAQRVALSTLYQGQRARTSIFYINITTIYSYPDVLGVTPSIPSTPPILWKHLPPSGILGPTLLNVVPVPSSRAGLKMVRPSRCHPLPLMLSARREWSSGSHPQSQLIMPRISLPIHKDLSCPSNN